MTTNIFRLTHKNKYCSIPVNWLRDRQISFCARGLLAAIISMEDNSVIDIETVAKKSVDGYETTMNAFKELQAAGYLFKVEDGFAVAELPEQKIDTDLINTGSRAAIERIENKLDEARKAGVNAWNLSGLVATEYDLLDRQNNFEGCAALTCYFVETMLVRKLSANEKLRTAQLVKRFGRIGFNAVDIATAKGLEDPFAYAFKVAEKTYEESKKNVR